MFQNYAAFYGRIPLEFSICDDGSVPPVRVNMADKAQRVIVSKLPEKKHPLNPCVPINRAVNASNGPIVVLTNAEIVHPAPVLWEMVHLLQHARDYVVAPCYDESRGWIAGPDVDYTTGGRLPVPPGGHFHFMAMFRRTLWEEVGGFDEDYRHGQACDDNDWLWRLYRAGTRFRVTKSIVVHTTRAAPIHWRLPHNAPLFHQKWPASYREALTGVRTT